MSEALAMYGVIESQYRTYFADKLHDSRNGKLALYSRLKHGHGIENYCNSIVNPEHRKALTRIRTSAHPLKVETGRYSRPAIERNLRLCNFCDLHEVEDEEHFLLRCKLYSDLRNQMFSDISVECKNFTTLSDYNKVFYLLNAEGPCIKSVAKFCYNSFDLRLTRV